MSAPDTVYDATDLQLSRLNDLVSGKLTTTDLATPENVQLILERHLFTLAELKAATKQVSELRTAVDSLTEQREDLRIKLAKAQERQSVLLLEIPLGAAIGFAIEMLNPDFNSGGGWALLIGSILMIIILRFPQVRSAFGKDKRDA